MKLIFKVAGVLVIFILLPTYVSANQWNQYSEFMNRFYFLDKQSFNNISCKVVVPSLNESWTQLKNQLRPYEDKIKINESSEFKLNFNRNTDLKLILPHFAVELISEEDFPDRNKVESVIKPINEEIQKQLNSICEIINELFKMYVFPKKDDVRIKQITKTKDVVRIIYEDEGMNKIDTYSGNKLESKQKGPDVEVQSYQTFKKVRNKLIIKNADVNMKLGEATAKFKTSIEYQEVKSIIFPARLVYSFNFVQKATQINGQIKVDLINCKID